MLINSDQSSQIMRFPRSDKLDACVLMHIKYRGPSALDLDLIGTEGERPFTGAVRQSRLNSYRSKNYRGTEDEWTHILLHVLGQTNQFKKKKDLIQTLGSLSLSQNDEHAIHLYDWASTAIGRADYLAVHCATLQNRYRIAEQTIENLTTQLDELIVAKTRHEEQLMNNFMQLLNEKKLKIRKQQRVIVPAELAVEEESRGQDIVPGSTEQPATTGTRPDRTASIASFNAWSKHSGLENLHGERGERQGSSDAVSDTNNELPVTQRSSEENTDSSDNQDTEGMTNYGSRTRSFGSKEIHSPPTGKKQLVPPRGLPFAKTTGDTIVTTRPDQHQQREASSSAGETDDDEL
ncbi:uncharacterized protein BP01DRAFT_369727 [Aspergillus saccharolyticus JOP 1030-1]|uniref:Uncharacterized protein n=1 Tax=Aspergillus saccharolyticus JOP 1030-1 TaxID=1450539 RepID=A0A318Z055_9EURO|nr:hypothetical protein BP01DRAFT_369727 [Aspergillus saccharolyticus JOP 1030-1]PYH40635.1 hypothetical protein BP01DRAFT_369727 [Aspergillus saccharolyticus JOP 1030-1]